MSVESGLSAWPRGWMALSPGSEGRTLSFRGDSPRCPQEVWLTLRAELRLLTVLLSFRGRDYLGISERTPSSLPGHPASLSRTRAQSSVTSGGRHRLHPFRLLFTTCVSAQGQIAAPYPTLTNAWLRQLDSKSSLPVGIEEGPRCHSSSVDPCAPQHDL